MPNKITVRIPTVTYGYLEPEFESIEQFEEEMPLLLQAYDRIKKSIGKKPVQDTPKDKVYEFNKHISKK